MKRPLMWNKKTKFHIVLITFSDVYSYLSQLNYKLKKNQLLERLLKYSVNVRPIWFPNHMQKMFKKYQKYKIKNANYIYDNYLCLPSSLSMNQNDIDYIYKLLK